MVIENIRVLGLFLISCKSKAMQTFLTNEQNSYEAQTFVKEAIDFLTSNSQFDFLQYENWFNGESEGQDFLYDANYWNNPSLSFPQQSLPSWNSFFNSYPRNSSGQWLTGANNVFSFVGGDVYKARQDYPNATNNTCALKVSIALNGAGINIPQITTTNGNPGTLKGADGKYYFLNAKSLVDFEKLIVKHEQIISSIIKLKPVKEKLFSDYFGEIKSLGAWGGDFVLATGNEETPKYFKNKGFETVLSYKEMIL